MQHHIFPLFCLMHWDTRILCVLDDKLLFEAIRTALTLIKEQLYCCTVSAKFTIKYVCFWTKKGIRAKNLKTDFMFWLQSNEKTNFSFIYSSHNYIKWLSGFFVFTTTPSFRADMKASKGWMWRRHKELIGPAGDVNIWKHFQLCELEERKEWQLQVLECPDTQQNRVTATL